MNIDEIMEHARLKGRVIALEAEAQTLAAEVRCLEAVIRSHERVDSLIVANLKAEVERLRASSFVTAVPVEQYERVVKAGDMLCFQYISLARKRWPNDPFPSSVTNWNATKEGKSSV